MNFIKKFKENFLPINRRILKRELARQRDYLEERFRTYIDEQFRISNQQLGNHLDERFDILFKKTSMPDHIWQIGDIRFFVPNYPLDLIQKDIVDSNHFYEQDILEDLSQFMPENPVICDIGANIGNHTLYWLSHNNARYVYCFEPRLESFHILEKNIHINNYDHKTKCFNLALSEKAERLSTSSFDHTNIGANSYIENSAGSMPSTPLDHLTFSEKIDFIKIDVEGMEISVLKGAEKTIRQNLPLIFIETFPDNFKKTNSILEKMNYSIIKEYRGSNYLFMPAN